MIDPQITQIQDQDPQTYSVIGAATEVHKTLGCGFLEAVYHRALIVEFALRKLPFHREVELPVVYKGITLDVGYRPDFICYDDRRDQSSLRHRWPRAGTSLELPESQQI